MSDSDMVVSLSDRAKLMPMELDAIVNGAPYSSRIGRLAAEVEIRTNWWIGYFEFNSIMRNYL